ncbi:hypothetical protein CBL_01445 [Carabus blaptoides fortunei]
MNWIDLDWAQYNASSLKYDVLFQFILSKYSDKSRMSEANSQKRDSLAQFLFGTATELVASSQIHPYYRHYDCAATPMMSCETIRMQQPATVTFGNVAQYTTIFIP